MLFSGIQTLIYLCVPSTLALYLWYKRFTTRVSPTVPYAGEGSLGSRLKVLAEYGSDPATFLIQQRKKLGDVFCVDLFLVKFVYFLGPEANRAILRAPENELGFYEFVKRFMGPYAEITMTDGFEEPTRKLMRVFLMSTEMLQNHAMSSEGLAEELFESWTCAPGGTIPLFESFSNMIYAYALSIYIGRQYYRERGTESIALMREFALILRNPLLQIFPPKLWHLLPPARRGHAILLRLNEMMMDTAREHFENKRQGLPVDDSTYLGLLCKNLDEDFTMQMTTQSVLVMFAFHSNIARIITWFLLHSRRVPGALERCRDEAQMRSSDKEEIGPYLESCIRETSRLYTNVSVLRAVPKHHPNGFTTILNHRVPSGTLVSCSPVVTHQDPTIYENPGKWIPERFLADDGKFYADRFRRLEFVQFGAGDHACQGEKLTRTVLLNNIMGLWLRKYDIVVVSGLEEGKGIDGVGVEVDWNKEPNGTPPAIKDVFVKVVKLS